MLDQISGRGRSGRWLCADTCVACSDAQASDDDGTKFLCSKAELIDELESSMPSWLRSDDWCAFCTTPVHERLHKYKQCGLTGVARECIC